jgi:hypothetical protein
MQLTTQQPWTASIPKPRCDATPNTAQLLIHSSMHATPSTATCRTTDAGLAWQQSTCVAAALDDRLHFWKWTSQADLDPPFVSQMPSPELIIELPPEREGDFPIAVIPQEMEDLLKFPPERVAWNAACRSALAAGASAQHCFSAAPGSHTAAVSVLVQVPTGGPLPG